MGNGKSVMSVVIANSIPSTTVLIVCPASLKIMWSREFKKWSARDYDIHIDTGGRIPAKANVVITNYERVRTDSTFSALMARRWDLLVMDECHRLSNPKTKQTQLILGIPAKNKKERRVDGLRDRATYVMGLSGTPLRNHPIDLFSILHALDPMYWKEFYAYAHTFCGARQVKIGWDVKRRRPKMAWDFTGASNQEDLNKKLLGTVMIRRRKVDVLPDLPPLTRRIIQLPAEDFGDLVNQEQALLERVYGGPLGLLTTGLKGMAPHDLAEFSRIRRELGEAKVPFVVDYLSDALQHSDKIIVFVHHKSVANAIFDKFKDVAAMLTGETKQEDRQRAVDSFQSDPHVRLFVCSIMAGGVGLTLTASAHEVFAEIEATPGDMEQAAARSHRPGQNRGVVVDYLLVDGSVEVRLAELAASKGENTERVIG